jgi:hypothetical protein
MDEQVFTKKKKDDWIELGVISGKKERIQILLADEWFKAQDVFKRLKEGDVFVKLVHYGRVKDNDEEKAYYNNIEAKKEQPGFVLTELDPTRKYFKERQKCVRLVGYVAKMIDEVWSDFTIITSYDM